MNFCVKIAKKKMSKEEKPTDYVPTPLLQINEFEEEASSTLDLAKVESVKIIQEAKAKAEEIICKVKEAPAILEKEYSEKVEKELAAEKERLIQNTQEQLERVKNILAEKIKQAVDYILKRIIPR